MSVALLKGAPAAQTLKETLSERAQRLKRPACLAIVRVGENPDDCSYERSIVKKCEQVGVAVRQVQFAVDCTPQQLMDCMAALNGDDGVQGILVMRPLPPHLQVVSVEERIAPHKDVDAMHPINLARVFAGEPGFAPCTAEAVIRLLEHADVALRGKHAVVIGRSAVVGRPLAMLLLQRDATVTICHRATQDLAALCRQADVLICAAGQANMVDAAYIKPGAVVVDVGIHVDADGNLCGDVDRARVGEQAAMITPVPGGVGAVTGYILVEHVIRAAEEMA